MTVEEALEELDSLFIPRDGEQDKFADAFEMAIQALERQKDINVRCEKCPYGKIEVVNICNYDGDGCGMD